MAKLNGSNLIKSFVYVQLCILNQSTNRLDATRLFAEVQKLEQERDSLRADWSRLKLEHSTLLNQVHVETQAKESLGMKKPAANELKVIRE